MMDGTMWVAAGALGVPNGTWLMHRRPLEKAHGGLWEFPGGKVEPAEKPVETLIRELSEELGIEVRAEDCDPAAFAEETAPCGRRATVILLYIVRQWKGDPRAVEGESVGWFDPNAIENLAKPPLDERLAAQLFKKA